MAGQRRLTTSNSLGTGSCAGHTGTHRHVSSLVFQEPRLQYRLKAPGNVVATVIIKSTTNMSAQYWFDIETLISESQPDSVLIIGTSADDVLADYVAQRRMLKRPCRIQFLHRDEALKSIPELGRFDAGIVVETLEFLDKRRAGQLIARLRDLHTSRFCALVPVGDTWKGLASSWSSAEFFSYGMKLLNRYATEAGPLNLYKYDIGSYKSTPEWLNSRNWANPGLWNKYRW